MIKNCAIKFLCFAICFISLSQTSIGQLNPLAVGTLSPGDSIVIYYDVTINNPCNCTQVSNQGTISGSNFITFNTDDPDMAPLGDPTITVLNMFPLPVRLMELKAQPLQGAVDVSWIVSHEENFLKYEVEKSSDGRNFMNIGYVAARNSQAQYSYRFRDLQPYNGDNFYRLKMIDVNGSFTYSVSVRVRLDGKGNSVSIYPNPILGQVFNLQFNNMQKGQYDIVFYSAAGQVVWRKMIYHDGGSMTRAINLGANFRKGFYNIVVRSASEVFTQPLLVQ